jgi:hypothetical protein
MDGPQAVPDTVHFVNVSPDDMSALLHVTDEEVSQDSLIAKAVSDQTAHPPLRLWQSRSVFDLVLGDHDQASLMLLDYCNSIPTPFRSPRYSVLKSNRYQQLV